MNNSKHKTIIWWKEWRPACRDPKCWTKAKPIKRLLKNKLKLKILPTWSLLLRKNWSMSENRDQRAILGKMYVRLNLKTKSTRWTSIAMSSNKNYQWSNTKSMVSMIKLHISKNNCTLKIKRSKAIQDYCKRDCKRYSTKSLIKTILKHQIIYRVQPTITNLD